MPHTRVPRVQSVLQRSIIQPRRPSRGTVAVAFDRLRSRPNIRTLHQSRARRAERGLTGGIAESILRAAVESANMPIPTSISVGNNFAFSHLVTSMEMMPEEMASTSDALQVRFVQVGEDDNQEHMTVHVPDTKARNTRPLDIDQNTAGVTHEMICPITLCVFNDPVMATDEQLYEREAITHAWRVRGFPFSPITGERLTSDSLFSCHAVRKMIEDIAERTRGSGSDHPNTRSKRRTAPVTHV